jgi:hypothetical protein
LTTPGHSSKTLRPADLEIIMASNTQETRYKRSLRRKNMGKERKRKVRANGSTPAFAIHTPEADGNAPSMVGPKSDS